MRPCAIGIVMDANHEKVLLVKRRDIPIWVLPGGGIEEGEEAELTAIREVEEESGVRTKIQRKVGDYFSVHPLTSPVTTFECRSIGGIPQPSDEASEAHFFPIASLPERLFHLHKEWLIHALEKHPHPLRQPITQVTYGKIFLHTLTHPLDVLRYCKARLLSFGWK